MSKKPIRKSLKPTESSIAIYKELKNKSTVYNEEIHCPLIIDIMSDPYKGTVSHFCCEALISDNTFYTWKARYPLFDDCYRYGTMVSKKNWEDEGIRGHEDESFNMDYWRAIGAARYGVGKSNRIRLEVHDEASPYEQYKQLLGQSANGDFTAGEIKQLMEAVNVGVRAYESFKLQAEVDEMKAQLIHMEKGSGENIIPIDAIKKTN